MKQWYVGKLGINLNEGGRFFTLYWRFGGLFRIWINPVFWVAGSRRFEYLNWWLK